MWSNSEGERDDVAAIRLLCHATASLTNQFGQFRHDTL
jgi:hypothetical protein